jgi:XTP/dITP diphosphohydrolase
MTASRKNSSAPGDRSYAPNNSPNPNPNRDILIATGNQGKLREIQAVMNDLPVTFKTLDQFPNLPDAVENGLSFAENAIIKAVHFSRLTGLWTLADDSGLEVDALNGRPGIHSARFAGPNRDDQANNNKLIRQLSRIRPEQRTARFQCQVVIADGDNILTEAAGTLNGLIVDVPQGTNGFGYDPHFLVPSLRKTTAQLTPELKNTISHRGLALANLKPLLRNLLRS